MKHAKEYYHVKHLFITSPRNMHQYCYSSIPCSVEVMINKSAWLQAIVATMQFSLASL